MSREPFEVGGGATRCNEEDIQNLFERAEKSAKEILGTNDSLIGKKEYLSPEGNYASIRRDKIMRDGEQVGLLIVASLFVPDALQMDLDEVEGGAEDEEVFEPAGVTHTFSGRYLELTFDTVDDSFFRVENFAATLNLHVDGQIEMVEGKSIFNIDTEHEDYDEENELVQLFQNDPKVPKMDDFMTLLDIVESLKT